MRPVSQATAEQGIGLVGDLSHGTGGRQVLLIDADTLRHFGLQPGDVRENLTVRGLDTSRLRAGQRLNVGEVLLEITDDCAPCAMLDELQPGLSQAIDGRRGVLARVVGGGLLNVGDRLELRASQSEATLTGDSHAG